MSTKLFIKDSSNDVQVAELGIISGQQQMILGDSERNLILRTVGSVQIQVGNKFYPLPFLSATNGTSVVVNSATTILNKDSELVSLTYPGDGNFVYVVESKSFYIASGNTYVKLSPSGQTITTPGGDTTDVLYLSYNSEQTLNGIQKSRLILNSGSVISSLNDIANYTQDSVYSGQLIYSIAEGRHYVLTNAASPQLPTSWTQVYLPLTGGTLTGTLDINPTVPGIALNVAGTSSVNIGDLSIFSNGISNINTSNVLGLAFNVANNNVLNLATNQASLFGQFDNNFNFTVNGTQKLTGLATLNKGLRNQSYQTGSDGSGYTLTLDPNDNKWLLEVDKIIVRDDIKQSSIFSTKSIDGSYWSNPSVKVTTANVLDYMEVYTLALRSGNYKDVSGTKVLIPLIEKDEYALVEHAVDIDDPSAGRTVSRMQILFGYGDRDSTGTIQSGATFIKNDSLNYVSVPGTYAYDGTTFSVDSSGLYINPQTISVVYLQSDNIAFLEPGDLLYYATWNGDTSEARVIPVVVQSLTGSGGAIVHVYNTENLILGQELIVLGRPISNNGIHFDGIDPQGDYIEHLVNVSNFRQVFDNFYTNAEGFEVLPVNTFKPQSALTPVKFGNLSNIVDTELSINGTNQVGLYSNNSYLKGNFVLNKALFNSVPTVSSYNPFIMLNSSKQLEKIDLSSKITQWDQAFSWGNHALAGYALQSTTITATGSGITGGGSLAANRTLTLDFTYLDTRYKAINSTDKLASGNLSVGNVPDVGGSYNITFTTPLTTTNYIVLTSINSFNLDPANDIVDCILVTAKSTTGFTIYIHEPGPLTQNISVDWYVMAL